MRWFADRRLGCAIVVAALSAVLAARGVAETTATWLTPSSGDWTDPAKWSSNPVYPNQDQPSVGDSYNAIINAIGTDYTVTLVSPITVKSLLLDSFNATFSQTAGTLTLLNGGTIASGTYLLGGGTISGVGNMNVTSSLNWNAGTIGGSGGLNILPGGVLTMGSSSFQRTLSRTLNNASVVNITNGGLTLNNGTFNNMASGVLNLSFGAIGATGTYSFSNAGTINAYGPATGVMNVIGSISFSNSGHHHCAKRDHYTRQWHSHPWCRCVARGSCVI